MTVNRLIWVAMVISIATYQIWPLMQKGFFYVGISIFIFVLSAIIFIQKRNLLSSFLLFCIALNNLLDELIFNPEIFGLNEVIFALTIPIIWWVKIKLNARKIRKQRDIHFPN